MLSHRTDDSTFASEVLTQYDMKDSRLTPAVLREALVRFKELAYNYPDEDTSTEECPHCGK